MRYVGIIPARYASSRFPGKPLCDLLGKPMIQRVFESASKWQQWEYLCVATDSQEIYDCCDELKIPCVMTKDTHVDCIDRCYEAAVRLRRDGITGDRYVIIQGDEPLFDSRVLDVDLSPEVVNLYTAVKDNNEIDDPNCVKVVVSNSERAIYFSRFSIPHFNKKTARATEENRVLKQIGVYSLSLDRLKFFHDTSPTFLENKEGIGMLRFIENDIDVNMRYTQYDSISVDTPNDRKKVIDILRERGV
jgi:3-deoxy-manno-octulosonate cytidylyltransferase (CMP-KDO synthetase)